MHVKVHEPWQDHPFSQIGNFGIGILASNLHKGPRRYDPPLLDGQPAIGKSL